MSLSIFVVFAFALLKEGVVGGIEKWHNDTCFMARQDSTTPGWNSTAVLKTNNQHDGSFAECALMRE
jgi:hypothetical protein